MSRKRAIRLAEQWSNGGVCTLREGEAKEYHVMCLAALREQEECEIQRHLKRFDLKEPRKTNADRIRAMNDEELAEWMAERYANQKNVEAEQRGEILTATQISAAYQTCYCILRRWFKQPYISEDIKNSEYIEKDIEEDA